MRILTCCLVLVLATWDAPACLWVTGTTYHGSPLTTSGVSPAWLLRQSIKANKHEDGIAMETRLRGSTNFNDRSDYAVGLLYLGRNTEAIKILETLESERPGQYFIAANLGTALELAGNNEEALRWINEGIRRDPESHKGTEWLHARILEAKIAQQKDADYFKKHSVLGFEAPNVGTNVLVTGQTLSTKQITDAIGYQLQERLQFVKPPDPAVASLLFDYAAIEASERTLESARSLMQMAVEYGYPADRVQPLLKLYDQKIAWRKTGQYMSYGLVALVLFALLYGFWRGVRFVFSALFGGGSTR